MDLETRSKDMKVVVVAREPAWSAEFEKVLDGARVLTVTAPEVANEVADGCDVLVVAVRSGSNGSEEAEILEHVRKHSPATVRFALVDESATDLNGSLAINAHSIWSTQVTPEVAARHCTAALDVTSRLSHMSLMELVGGVGHLPSLPSLYMELQRELQNRSSSLKSVAVIVSRDPGVAAKVMQLANSSFFSRGGEVTDIHEAVTLLGVGVLRAIVLAVKLFRGIPMNLGHLFEHSFHTGLVAMALARSEGAARRVVDLSFLAGLLHDIGQLVLAGAPKLYGSVRRTADARGIPFRAAELEELGTDHAELGAYLLRLWGLPEDVTRAVLYHHEPSAQKGGPWLEGGTESPSIALLVHVANFLAMEAGTDEGDSVLDELDKASLEQTGLLDKLTEWRPMAKGICKIPFSM